MPLPAIRMQIGSGIELIVQLARQRDGSRKVTHITEVAGFDAESGKYALHDLYVLRHDPSGSGRSALEPTGRLPGFGERLTEHGVELPAEMLQAARVQRARGEP